MANEWARGEAVEIVEKYKIEIGKEGEEIAGQEYLVGLIIEQLLSTAENS